MSESVLAEAERIIGGDRQNDYGDPAASFRSIAKLWDWYLTQRLDEGALTATDVAHMMILLKVSRATTGGPKRDTYVDLAGYAALAERLGSAEVETTGSTTFRAVAPPDRLIPGYVLDVRVGQARLRRTRTVGREGQFDVTTDPDGWFGSTYYPDCELYNVADYYGSTVEFE